MSRKYKTIKKEEEELVGCKCGWCKKPFFKRENYWMEGTVFGIGFGYGSVYDLQTFHFEVCDKCFEKYLKKFTSKEEHSWCLPT